MFADALIRPDRSLLDTATILGEIFGVDFLKDVEGRYDEFPAYVAESDGRTYALLGEPHPEDDIRDAPSNEFQFMLRPDRFDPRIAKQNISAEVVSQIVKDGRLYCWEME